ncbi:MAG: hypothetical protein ACRCWJ_12490 [Casimicrobium sp.]
MSLLAHAAHANGRVVVNNDEWTISDSGFTSAGGANAATFVANLKTYLNGSNVSGCNFLVISSNFGLTGATLSTQMTAAPACTWTVNSSAAFTVSNLSGYDAVFLAGSITSVATGADVAAVLTPYVAAGGSVYIAAGTGGVSGGSAGEAAYWNPFLNTLGISLDANYTVTTPTNDPITGTHPLLAGVSTLFFDNGNAITAANTAFGSQIIETGTNGGQLAIYDRANDTRLLPPPTVPALPPGLLSILAVILAAVAFRRSKLQ